MRSVDGSRLARRALLMLVPIIGIAAALYLVHLRRVHAANDLAVSCYGGLNKVQYPAGITSATLTGNTAVAVVPGLGLQLDTNLSPFNAQKIVFPFDQQVNVKYVYRNAGASHSFGWFYLDQIAPFLKPDGTLKDADADGVPDWFQTQNGVTRPNMGLWKITAGQTIPDIANSVFDYSDGGSFPHVPNILETLTGPGKGQWIFKLCDDDGDTSVYGVGSTVGSFPVLDGSGNSDGIPDYDVNGDGTIGNAQDRSQNLGIIQGNREIVFFALTYYDNNLPRLGMGLTGAGSLGVKVMPFFTKNILNPDRGTRTPGTVLQKVAIKCEPAESTNDSACWSPLGGTNGWMTPAAQARLNTAVYNNTDLTSDPGVVPIVVDADGSAPHFVVFPPASNPNLWLIGFEDLPVNSGDNDYNDVVFMVERANGGQVISDDISTDIPAALKSSTAISKVHITYKATFPAPGCTGVTGAAVKIYYSVDGGVTWNAIPMVSPTVGDVIIDVLGNGIVGSQLKWRADFISPVQACQPALTEFNIGYEAVSNGLFKYAAPIPLSNVVYGGALETPPFPAGEPLPTRNDFSVRGHFYSTQLYDQTNPNATLIKQNWDAGFKLAQTVPTARRIFTNLGGTMVAFDALLNGPTLYPLILPSGVRTATQNATLVYDFDGNNVVNDQDARYVLDWTRGWEYPPGITILPTPSVQPLARGWPLGSVHNSSPAVVGPPVRPTWIDGSAAPALLASKHNAYRAANSDRPTRAVVGSQDGMVHAFDAGQYRVTLPTTLPACDANLNRGCYAGSTDAVRYGTGAEIWAVIPASQISQMKNNHPTVRNYLPTSNPLAEVDGSVSVEDIWDPSLGAGGDFRTIVFASLGTSQRYITAIDMSSDNPKAPWATDFTDVDFNGSNLSPSVGLTEIPSSPFYRHLVVTSSGLNSAADNLFVYFLDALTGAIVNKIQLNTGLDSAPANGIASYVNLVDADQNGLVDRVYAADTSGRIWKTDTTTNAHCMIASVGEAVYAGMAVRLTSDSTAAVPKVEFFVGGGSNPDGTGAVSAATYHIFAYQDNDPVGICTRGSAQLVYRVPLASGDKVWAAPFIGGDNVFFATANAASVSICANGNGTLMTLSTTGDGTGNPTTTFAPQSIGGAPISSMRVYDGHALINTVGGSTTVMGGNSWNNAATTATGGAGTVNQMRTLLWQEQ